MTGVQTCALPIWYVQVLTPDSRECEEVIKLRILRGDHPGCRVGPKSGGWYLNEGKEREVREAQERRQRRAETGVTQPHTTECRGPPEAEGSSPTGMGGKATPSTPSCRTFGLSNGATEMCVVVSHRACPGNPGTAAQLPEACLPSAPHRPLGHRAPNGPRPAEPGKHARRNKAVQGRPVPAGT